MTTPVKVVSVAAVWLVFIAAVVGLRAMLGGHSKPADAAVVASAPAGLPAAGIPTDPFVAPVAERIDFGAKGLAHGLAHGLAKSAAQPAPAGAWTPVVTPAAEATVPAAAAADSKNRSALTTTSAEPQSAWDDISIPDTHASVAPVLAAHPDRDLILCLAGCGGGMSIVEIRRRPQIMVSGEMIPASGGGRSRPDEGDVICIAGCVGAPGAVVFKNVRLSWISDEGGGEIKAALRAIANRVAAAEGLRLDGFARTWVSGLARDHLLREAPGAPQTFAFAGPQVAAWMRRLPTAIVTP